MEGVRLAGKQGIFYIRMELLKKQFIDMSLGDDIEDFALYRDVSKAADRLFVDRNYVLYWLRENFEEVLRRSFERPLMPGQISVIDIV